jgi:hypothetical protein
MGIEQQRMVRRTLISQRTYKNEKYKIPVFVPIDLFFIPKKKEFYELLIRYIENKEEFDGWYEKLLLLTGKF